eukprot:gene2944-3673_t
MDLYFMAFKYPGHPLFKFERMGKYLDIEELPTSSDEERNQAIQWSSVNQQQLDMFSYSFQFIENYRPKKFKLETTHDVDTMRLHNLDGVLKYGRGTIETIKFSNHPTPYRFLEQCLMDENGIKSIRFEITNHVFPEFNEKQFRKYTQEEINDEEYDRSCRNKMFEMVLGLLSKNTILKRLVIKDLPLYEYSRFFKCLFDNQKLKLKALGFETSEHGHNGPNEVTSLKDLEPLLQLPSIKVLYCYFNSVSTYLDHKEIQVH